ncbi:hypothetical protein KSF73_01775 [Burkholderiaceae bacterium DAT-1]|nr:hypothetical protein [Burkholderiaceae bacterium DAT-1]
MKWLLWLILIAGAAVGLAQFAQLNTGYTLIFAPPWRIELSLNAFAVLFLLLVFGAFMVFRMIDWVLGMPEQVTRYRARQKLLEARRLRTEALSALLEGRPQKTERALRKIADQEEDPATRAIDALVAAYAAHEFRDLRSRDAWLETARELNEGDTLAQAMLEATLCYRQHRNREALAAIERARALSPNLTAALKLELRIRQREGQNERVIELSHQLEKSEALERAQASRLRARARLNQLRSEDMDPDMLTRFWAQLDEEERLQPRLAAEVARALQQHGQTQRAEHILVEALTANWDSNLVDALGALPADTAEADILKRIGLAEEWLTQHRDDHHLLLTLGRLCRHASLWGKARTYLDASIAVHASAIAHAELGGLLEQLGEVESANVHYRFSLGLALDSLEGRN